MANAKPLPFAPFDTEAFVAAQQRNFDALASASQIVVDGVRTIAQRQGELVQSSVDQLMAVGKNGFNPDNLQPADQFTKAKASYDVAVNNAKELAEIAMKAQGEAVAVLSKCVTANIDDLKVATKSA